MYYIGFCMLRIFKSGYNFYSYKMWCITNQFTFWYTVAVDGVQCAVCTTIKWNKMYCSAFLAFGCVIVEDNVVKSDLYRSQRLHFAISKNSNVISPENITLVSVVDSVNASFPWCLFAEWKIPDRKYWILKDGIQSGNTSRPLFRNLINVIFSLWKNVLKVPAGKQPSTVHTVPIWDKINNYEIRQWNMLFIDFLISGENKRFHVILHFTEKTKTNIYPKMNVNQAVICWIWSK